MAERTASSGAEWRAHGGIVLAAFAGMSLASVAPYSIGIMIPAIQQDTGWSRTQISAGQTMISLIAMLFGPIMGAAMDRFGTRRLALSTATLLCGALAMMSLATRSAGLWLLLWGLVGIGSSAMPGVWTVPVSRRFTLARGLALAIVLSGSGIGASLVPLIAGYGVQHYGWRTAYLMLGGCWAVLTLPLIFLFYDGQGTPTAPAATGIAAGDDRSGMTVREALCSPAFYALALATLGTSLAGTALIFNLVPILIGRGLPLPVAARIVSTIGVATIVGRLVGGYLMDRIPAYLIASVAALATLTLPLLLLFAPGSRIAATIGVIVFGLTAGPKTTAIVYLARRQFGSRELGTINGIFNALMATGLALGPLIANAIYDARRSYDAVIVGAIPILLSVACLFFLLRFCAVPAASVKSTEALA